MKYIVASLFLFLSYALSAQENTTLKKVAGVIVNDNTLFPLSNVNIININKVRGTISNAIAFMEVQKEFGSFSKYIWNFTDGKPIENNRKSLREVPSTTPLSDAISKDLKKRGWSFVGPTTVYAFMQAMGMVNDHLDGCHRRPDLEKRRASFKRPS